MKKREGHAWLDDIMCTATSAHVVDQAEEEIAALLRERHHIKPGADDDFNLRHPTEVAEVVKQSTQTMELLLAAIASVSLLVGGIGIMNVMLVSVTERTREIGLRMAIGAKGRDVLFQFLTEAVALACAGGAIGVLIGSVATRLVAAHFQWQALFSLPVMAGTILLAGLAGGGGEGGVSRAGWRAGGERRGGRGGGGGGGGGRPGGGGGAGGVGAVGAGR